MKILSELDKIINLTVELVKNYGIFSGCILIIIESILPMLPLCTFITLNFLLFGNFLGFIVSWLCTIIGCLLAFCLIRSGYRKWSINKITKNNRFSRFMNRVERLSFPRFVVLVALPFTPAFLVNIVFALSKKNFEYFLLGIIIGKSFMVYFWGYVGTSLVDSLREPGIIFRVILICLGAYVLGFIINKKFDIN